MRIGLIMEQALAPVPGGTGRYSIELARALARNRADVVEGWTAWHRDSQAAQVDDVGGPHRFVLARRPLIAAWERGLGPAPRRADVVHALTPLFPPRRGRPLVVAVHDTVPWTHSELLTPRGARWHRAMVARAAQTADAVTVLTRAVADELVEFVPALRPERVHVIGAGVSRSLLDEPETGEVSPVVPPGYLLSVATLEPRKGLDVLLEALARLGERAPTLVLAGQPGWGGIEPLEQAARSGLAPGAVRVMGRVSDAELALLMRGAAAVVVPSRAEGFGLPIVEAMAVGTPVICSDVPAMVEVAADAAIVVPRGDAAALAEAILEVGQPRRRDELIRAGRLRATEFTWDAVADRARAVYAQLIGSPGR
ncbi:MAG: hypothetical protein JWM76_5110 [Pseudonocardiales bacterium]|nr:hypothetical protein [Pseudonocardiales bacterium]